MEYALSPWLIKFIEANANLIETPDLMIKKMVKEGYEPLDLSELLTVFNNCDIAYNFDSIYPEFQEIRVKFGDFIDLSDYSEKITFTEDISELMKRFTNPGDFQELIINHTLLANMFHFIVIKRRNLLHLKTLRASIACTRGGYIYSLIEFFDDQGHLSYQCTGANAHGVYVKNIGLFLNLAEFETELKKYVANFKQVAATINID